ncbi:MAG: MFS transporter [Clostridia bacterium]|nr:MFS transporter [Clostridia bacterium]
MTPIKNQDQQKHGLTIVIIVVAACLIFSVMQGVHDNYGIMMKALVPETGVSYQNISFIIGIGAIMYGATQPFFGMLALKRSNAFVMLLGIVLMASGLVLTPLCKSFFPMLLMFGIVLPSGTGALCFGIIMGAVTPMIGEKRAAVCSGIIQASAGIGDALMSPALQGLIGRYNILTAMSSFAVLIVLTVPAVLWMRKKQQQLVIGIIATDEQPEGLFHILKSAVSDPLFRHIFIGFSTCGFNMSIIESHLFSQYVSWGIPKTEASIVMGVYGVLTMIGAIITGFLGSKFSMKNVLGSVYLIRVFVCIAMFIVPKTIPAALILTGFLGMSGDSTVPPTTGLITRRFGSKQMAVIYGFAFIGHQTGAFLSACFGGWCFTHWGSYQLLWAVNMVLCMIAALASFSIKENKAI